MKTHVIYHRADYDGLLSAAVCLHFVPDTVIHGWDYGDPTPEIPGDCETLYIVDLSVPELMDDPRLIWIDHHKSAIEKWGSRRFVPVPGDGEPCDVPIRGIRIDGVAACRLCWQWFTWKVGEPKVLTLLTKEDFARPYAKPLKVEEPLVLTLAGEYDVWDLHDQRAIWLQHGLAAYSHDPKVLVEFLSEYEDAGPKGMVRQGDLRTEALLGKGAIIEDFSQEQARNTLANRSYFREWEGLRFLCLNGGGNSRSFPKIDKEWNLIPGEQPGFTWEHIDAFLMWKYDGSKVTVSLYHKPGREDLDLSVIAVKYGGGGHKGACGFQVKARPLSGIGL